MSKLVAPVIDGGLAEHDIFGVHLIVLRNLLGVHEPHQVNNPRPISHVCHNTFLPRSHIKLLEAQNLPFHLYERHLAGELIDMEHPTAVHIFIRIILQQVTKCLDAQFLAQDLLSLRTDSWHILNVLFEDGVHF